jgi:hypothetical protein
MLGPAVTAASAVVRKPENIVTFVRRIFPDNRNAIGQTEQTVLRTILSNHPAANTYDPQKTGLSDATRLLPSVIGEAGGMLGLHLAAGIGTLGHRLSTDDGVRGVDIFCSPFALRSNFGRAFIGMDPCVWSNFGKARALRFLSEDFVEGFKYVLRRHKPNRSADAVA